MRVLEPGQVTEWVHEVLLNPARDKPVVAVTTRPRTGETWIEPRELAEALGDAGEVVLLETGDATWELAEALPPLLDVYGGAVRVWWPGLRVDSNPRDHRLFLINSPERARAIFERIVAEATGTAPEGRGAAVVEDAPSEVLEGRVEEIEGARVEISAKERRGTLTDSDLPLIELVRSLDVGITLPVRAVRALPDGRWNFSTRGLLPSPWLLVGEGLKSDDVIMARVQKILDIGAIVEILPTVTALLHVSEVDWTYVQTVEEFVRPGQVVAVKILVLDAEKKKFQVSIKRALGLDPKPLPALVPGGRPFTWPEEAVSAEDEEFATLTRDELRERVLELNAELEAADADRRRLAETNKEMRAQLHEMRKEVRGAEAREQETAARFAQEEDPLGSERAFLLAVRLRYARLFDEGSRQDYPLQRLRVGPQFLDSVHRTQGIDLEKILEVCAQVAAGQAHEIASREVHQLRDGPRGANSRVRARDGAQAWRCALQTHTASARRLHWWNVPGEDGATIEFASVGLHDSVDIPE